MKIECRITKEEKKKIQNLIDTRQYSNITDFLKEAIKDELDGNEIINLRDIGRDEAKKEVVEYYKEYGIAYLSDVADALRLDYHFVFDLTEELVKEGRLEWLL